MTINESQGQTFQRTELPLSETYFEYGQLYVVFSWCGYLPDDNSNTQHGFKKSLSTTQYAQDGKNHGE